MPLLVMQTMCESTVVNKDYSNDPKECFQEATAMMFVFSIGWHIVFWSYGYGQLASLHHVQNEPYVEIIESDVIKNPIHGTESDVESCGNQHRQSLKFSFESMVSKGA